MDRKILCTELVEVFEEPNMSTNRIGSDIFDHPRRRKQMATSNKVKYVPFLAEGLEKFGSVCGSTEN